MCLISTKDGASIMSIKFSKALLMHGEDYQLTDSITLHHPTVGEILSIDQSPTPERTYWSYVNILLADPYLNMVMLDDMGKNYLETSPYEVFILQWDNFEKDYQENKASYDAYGMNPSQTIIGAFQFFINGGCCFQKGIYENGDVCFYDKNNPSCQINKEVFECIYEWVKSINKIDYSNRIKPADENARRVLIEDMRDEMKKAKKRKKRQDDDSDYFGNIMSAVSFCGNGAITPFNMKDCKIYWLNEALSISIKKSNAGHLLDGIYHGTISSKDIKKKELDWIN